MSMEIVPVILAGGEGRRLRPLTSPSRPKPFLKLFGRPSLFQQTLKRLPNEGSGPIVITHDAFERQAERQAEELGVNAQVIAEPANRSTAPAIALAAFELKDRSCAMLVMPSDHFIQDRRALSDAIERATSLLTTGTGETTFVSIGVPARTPATRYGYILFDDDKTITTFTEKPDGQTAKTYIASGHCAWNTGIFLCRPQSYLDALKTHRPELYDAAEAYVRGQGAYKYCPGEAVDTAIMENISGTKVAILQTEWHDLGTHPEFFMHFFRTAS